MSDWPDGAHYPEDYVRLHLETLVDVFDSTNVLCFQNIPSCIISPNCKY